MTDRTVSVRLQAVIGPYSAAMAKATKDTRDFQKAIVDGKQETQDLSKKVGTGMVLAGAAVAAGFGLATKATMEFDRAMSEVSAVAGATGAEMSKLRDAAIDAGAATSFSATEAAQAQAELVKAGISVTDVLNGGLTGALDLAAAGSLDLAQAAEIAAQAMNIFKLRGDDVTHIADVLAAGANKSAADVAQLGDALRQGGLVASQTGLSLEETTGALSAFADNALVGSDAGTSLKAMLQRLTPQSDEAAQLMEQLGFSAYDAAGNFVGLEGLAGELRDALSDMTVEQRNAAMATLFGSDAVRAANILYSQGEGGIRNYVQAVDDQGAAADMAAEKLNNLSGDLEELSGSIETQLIEGGSKATGVLRGMAQGATDLVNGFGTLPDSLQTVALGIGVVTGAATLAGGAFLLVTPKVAAAKIALVELGVSAPAAATGLKSVGAAAGIATAALIPLTVAMTTWGNIQTRGKAVTDDFLAGLPDADSLDSRRDRLNALIGEYERLQGVARSGGGIGKGLREIGQLANPFDANTISEAEAATHNFVDAIERERDELAKLEPKLNAVTRATGMTDVEAQKLADTIGVDLLAAGIDGTSAVASVIAEYDRIGSGIPDAERMTMTLEEQEEAAKQLAEELTAVGDAAGEFTDVMAGYSAVYDRAEEAAREHAEELANIENRRIDDQIDGIRDAAEVSAQAIQQEAEDYISNAGIAGQAASDVRAAAKDKADAVRSSADDESEALGDSKASWEDYVDEVTVSTDELIEEWRRQVEALSEWRTNLGTIALRGREDVAEILAGMGPEGAALTQQFAEMTDAEFQEAGDLFVASMNDGGEAAGLALQEQLAIAEVIGRDGAMKTADAIAEELGVGVDKVRYIAAMYGVVLGEGLRSFWSQVAAARAALAQLQVAVQIASPYTSTPGLQVYAGGVNGATGGLVPQYRAAGGPILDIDPNFGPRGRDTVPAFLEPGEYVQQKSAVDKYGLGTMSKINAGTFAMPAPMSQVAGGNSSGGTSHTDNSRSSAIHMHYHGVSESPEMGVTRAARKAEAVMG